LRRRSALEQQHGADATAMAEDLIRGLRVIKGLGAERAAVAGYLRSSRQALAASRRSAAAQSVLAASAALISGMYLAVVVGVGGWLALSGHLGLGPLVSALGLAQFVLGPMRTLGGAGAGYARAVASAGRIQDVLRRPSAVVAGPGVAEPEVSAGIDVRFDDVDLPTTHTANGCRASFTVPARQLTGLVIGDPVAAGAVGALLARERDPGSGAITVAGAEIAQWSLGRLRELVLVAPHAGALFEGSVGENIAVRARDDTAVRQATWAAFADQVIDTLPEREHTAVGDRGQSLSGGQRQRVALARALAADAPVLVLQDPTTSVDAVTEDRIAARLAELRAGRTTLLITSSPALLARCDRVIVLDGDGRRAGPAGRLATLADRSGGTNR
jgi:putative ABC transport system ATP-binding protein